VGGLKFNCVFSLIVQFFGESDVTFGGKLWVYGCWLVGTFASMRKPVLLNIIQLHKESYNEAVTLREYGLVFTVDPDANTKQAHQ
jgi:hypothetical protein